MILLDTDILSLVLAGHAKVRQRLADSGDDFAITIITRIEVLQGRFDSVLKAADGTQLRQALAWLEKAERDLGELDVEPLDDVAADEFDRLRQIKKLNKIGRADLLIASIALARKARLVTRNVRHFQLVPGLLVENWAD